MTDTAPASETTPRNNTRLILGGVGGTLLLCVCCLAGGLLASNLLGGALLERFLIEEPAQVEQTARQILDYDLPPGYREELGMDIIFGQMVLLSASEPPLQADSQPIIMLVSLDPSVDPEDEQIRRQLLVSMRQAMSRQNLEFNLVEQEERSLRDQDVTVFYYEGMDESGAPMRQVLTEPFKGKNGTVILMILGPEAGWDTDLIAGFLDSLR